MKNMFNSIYYIFRYPLVVVAWLLFASVANSAVKAETLYRCVIIDTSLAGKDKSVEKNTFLLDQVKGNDEARYVGKTATLDFNFGTAPIKITARHPSKDRIFDFSDTRETTSRFDGYIEDADIEIHCKKRPVKSK